MMTIFTYLIFSNATVMTARMIPTIQNMVTIFASGSAFPGLWINAWIPSFWKWWWRGAILNTLRPSPYFFFVYLKYALCNITDTLSAKNTPQSTGIRSS